MSITEKNYIFITFPNDLSKLAMTYHSRNTFGELSAEKNLLSKKYNWL